MQKLKNILIPAAMVAIAMSSAAAQEAPAIALDAFADAEIGTLEVTLPNLLDEGGEIAERFSQYGDNISPEINWSAGPDGTQSYAVIVEDPIAAMNFVVLHWTIYNIPANLTSLPEGIAEGRTVADIEGARQAKNVAEAFGYAGPRPPEGPAHNYHFQVFALDTTLDVPEDVALHDLLAAMQGHVLAAGELVANYAYTP